MSGAGGDKKEPINFQTPIDDAGNSISVLLQILQKNEDPAAYGAALLSLKTLIEKPTLRISYSPEEAAHTLNQLVDLLGETESTEHRLLAIQLLSKLETASNQAIADTEIAHRITTALMALLKNSISCDLPPAATHALVNLNFHHYWLPLIKTNPEVVICLMTMLARKHHKHERGRSVHILRFLLSDKDLSEGFLAEGKMPIANRLIDHLGALLADESNSDEFADISLILKNFAQINPTIASEIAGKAEVLNALLTSLLASLIGEDRKEDIESALHALLAIPFKPSDYPEFMLIICALLAHSLKIKVTNKTLSLQFLAYAKEVTYTLEPALIKIIITHLVQIFKPQEPDISISTRDLLIFIRMLKDLATRDSKEITTALQKEGVSQLVQMAFLIHRLNRDPSKSLVYHTCYLILQLIDQEPEVSQWILHSRSIPEIVALLSETPESADIRLLGENHCCVLALLLALSSDPDCLNSIASAGALLPYLIKLLKTKDSENFHARQVSFGILTHLACIPNLINPKIADEITQDCFSHLASENPTARLGARTFLMGLTETNPQWATAIINSKKNTDDLIQILSQKDETSNCLEKKLGVIAIFHNLLENTDHEAKARVLKDNPNLITTAMGLLLKVGSSSEHGPNNFLGKILTTFGVDLKADGMGPFSTHGLSKIKIKSQITGEFLKFLIEEDCQKAFQDCLKLKTALFIKSQTFLAPPEPKTIQKFLSEKKLEHWLLPEASKTAPAPARAPVPVPAPVEIKKADLEEVARQKTKKDLSDFLNGLKGAKKLWKENPVVGSLPGVHAELEKIRSFLLDEKLKKQLISLGLTASDLEKFDLGLTRMKTLFQDLFPSLGSRPEAAPRVKNSTHLSGKIKTGAGVVAGAPEKKGHLELLNDLLGPGSGSFVKLLGALVEEKKAEKTPNPEAPKTSAKPDRKSKPKLAIVLADAGPAGAGAGSAAASASASEPGSYSDSSDAHEETFAEAAGLYSGGASGVPAPAGAGAGAEAREGAFVFATVSRLPARSYETDFGLVSVIELQPYGLNTAEPESAANRLNRLLGENNSHSQQKFGEELLGIYTLRHAHAQLAGDLERRGDSAGRNALAHAVLMPERMTGINIQELSGCFIEHPGVFNDYLSLMNPEILRSAKRIDGRPGPGIDHFLEKLKAAFDSRILWLNGFNFIESENQALGMLLAEIVEIAQVLKVAGQRFNLEQKNLLDLVRTKRNDIWHEFQACRGGGAAETGRAIFNPKKLIQLKNDLQKLFGLEVVTKQTRESAESAESAYPH